MNFSIVIPTFNRSIYLCELITEIMKQIYNLELQSSDNFEVLIVDNSICEDAKLIVSSFYGYNIRYFSEKTPGVVFARNRGIKESRGKYIIFIDDDEIPGENWLKNFSESAKKNFDACFGKVVPHFESMPEGILKKTACRVFSRNINVQNETDITKYRPYLGAGNSMFNKERCFYSDDPFEHDFNCGGEDVRLLYKLVSERGIRLTWIDEAVVYERVPPDRVTYHYLSSRRRKDGQIRRLAELDATMYGRLKSVKWAVIGAAQALIYKSAAIMLYKISPVHATWFSIEAESGIGKLFPSRRV